MTRVYNGGTYDLLHAGHLFAFFQMRAMAGKDGEVIIGLNTDEFVERFKGHPTVQSLAERIEIVSAIRYVDRVVVNVGNEDAKPILELVRPDIIAVGFDWWDGPANSDMGEWGRYLEQMDIDFVWLGERGMHLRHMAWAPDRSSTRLRQLAMDSVKPPRDVIMTHSGRVELK